MNTRRHNYSIAVFFILLFVATTSPAIDIGAPIYRSDFGSGITLDLTYQSLKRDIEQETPFTDQTWKGEQEEKHYVAAIMFPLNDRVSGKLEVGLADSKGSEDIAPLFGAVLQAALYDVDGLCFNVFAAGRYVSGIQYKTEGVYFTQGGIITEYPEVTREEEYFELGGGLTLSKIILTGNKTKINPYGGILLSLIDGSGEETFRRYIVQPGTATDDSVDFEAENPFSIVAGISALFTSNIGLRIEGRFVNQTSVSAGAFFIF